MTDVSPKSAIIQGLSLEDVAAYLALSQWRFRMSKNGRWREYTRAADLDGQQLEIVLPVYDEAPDAPVYVASAVNLLSALGDEAPDVVVQRIKHYDCDIFDLVNPVTPADSTLPLELASAQVYQLRQLVLFSGSSEVDPRPRHNNPRATGRAMTEHYRFAHTFPGSFGFRIESRVVGEPQEYYQLKLDIPEETIVRQPIERRVMERIVRGINIVHEAAERRDATRIVESYTVGFNANMCDAIVGMSDKMRQPLECRVLWSPRLAPSPDLARMRTTRLDVNEYKLMTEASQELGQLRPENVSITGLVTQLSSKDDPVRVSDADRSVVIQWMDRPGRPAKIIAALGSEDYIKAHRAHLNWFTVKVEGVLVRLNNQYQLADAHNFQVIDSPLHSDNKT